MEADPLTTTPEITQELSVSHSIVIWHLKLGRWKSSVSGCLMSRLQIQKITILKFFYSMQQQWTISQSDCDVQWKVNFIQHPVTTSSVVGQRRGSKAFPKAKLARARARVRAHTHTHTHTHTFTHTHTHTGDGHCLVVCCWSDLTHYSFLNPSKTITPEEYAQQIKRWIENCNTCNQICSTERARFFSATTPDCVSHNWCFKPWMNSATKFCHNHLP